MQSSRRLPFLQALRNKRNVYLALTLRFMITRYGRENIGFLWIVIEPMILCVGVMGVWSLTKGSLEHGLRITAVVYSGYMALTLWRHMTNAMVYVVRSGKFLTNFRGISQLDIVLCRLFMEFVSVTAAAIAVYSILHSLSLLPDIYSLGLIMIGWLTMGALGAGGGLLMVGATENTEVAEKFVQPLQYLMIPFSGCFFFLNWLPDAVRENLAYVPFVHSFEMIRAGIFGPSVITYSDPWYSIKWAIVTSAAGLWLVGRARDRIQP